MVIAIGGLLLALLAGPGADVKGKWDGTVTAQNAEGNTSNDTVLLLLDQKDTTVTGTVGGNEADQHPITKGTIEGSKVILLATHQQNGREYRIELTLDGDEMKGTVKTGDRVGQLVVKRRKE